MTSKPIKRTTPADRVTRRPKSKEEQTSARVATIASKIMRVARGYRPSDILMRSVNHDGSVTRIRVSDVTTVCGTAITQTKDKKDG